jgi:DNA modification methylase
VFIDLPHIKTCACPGGKLSCLDAKSWVKAQVGVWRVAYEKDDIRDKTIHPATFPIQLARRVIELFTHEGELVLDPFCGIGTTLLAAKQLNRNAIGIDINLKYIEIANQRLSQQLNLSTSKQMAICDDAINIDKYISGPKVKLVWTSPPYMTLLNRVRENKSRKNRKNYQYGRIEQYSQLPNDLGNQEDELYYSSIKSIFEKVKAVLRPDGHCVINVGDFHRGNKLVLLHEGIIETMTSIGYKLENIIIWDKTNLVNGTGIFGYPKRYMTMYVTYEYLLHFVLS